MSSRSEDYRLQAHKEPRRNSLEAEQRRESDRQPINFMAPSRSQSDRADIAVELPHLSDAPLPGFSNQNVAARVQIATLIGKLASSLARVPLIQRYSRQIERFGRPDISVTAHATKGVEAFRVHMQALIDEV